MPDVIHRTTLEFRTSVNGPDFPEPVWKWEPSMAAVAGVPSKYWKAPADWDAAGAGPVEMSTGEKATADAAIQTAKENVQLATLDAANYVDLLRALSLVVLDEINIVRAASVPPLPGRTVAQLKTALRGKMS